MRAAVTILAFVLVLSSIGIAFQNEPEGFRRLKWGDPPTEDMVLWGEGEIIGKYLVAPGISSYEGEKIYTRCNEEMSIDDVRINLILYSFHRDRFKSVYIYFRGRENYERLKASFIGRFGPGEKQDQCENVLFWTGFSDVFLDYEPIRNWGTVEIFNVNIYFENLFPSWRTNKKESTHGGTDDF